MTTIKEILETIDTSKMEDDCFVDIYSMCESEFEIYEWLNQPKDNVRLTCCYYHSWTCTDTEVGIRVWYLDNNPVCISWQPFRKSNEEFGWLSQEAFDGVKAYIVSLQDNEVKASILSDDKVNSVALFFDSIEHKKFEQRNIK